MSNDVRLQTKDRTNDSGVDTALRETEIRNRKTERKEKIQIEQAESERRKCRAQDIQKFAVTCRCSVRRSVVFNPNPPNNALQPHETRAPEHPRLGVMKEQRSLIAILQSTSGVLFPAELGDKPVELTSRSSEGDTPLHVVTWRDDLDAAQILVEAGAEIDALGDMDQTPLHVAVMKQNEAVAELLLRAGANADIRSEFGDTPREMALSQGGSMEKVFRNYAGAQQKRCR